MSETRNPYNEKDAQFTREALQYMADHCSLTESALAVGYGRNSFNSIAGLFDLYEVTRPHKVPIEPSWKRSNAKEVKPPVEKRFKSSHQVLKDGTEVDSRTVTLEDNEVNNPEAILRAHGYDPLRWDMVSYKNSEWEQRSNQEGLTTLYASAITVRPRNTQEIDRLEHMAAAIKAMPEMTLQKEESDDVGGLLVINLHDLHMGNSTLEDYMENIKRAVKLIRSRMWEQILIPFGSDMFQANNFENTTVKGTLVDGMEWSSTFGDADKLFEILIQESIRHAISIHVPYVPGNHSAFAEWMFLQLIKAKYPQLIVDLGIQERKVHVYGGVCLGLIHKLGKNEDRTFRNDFPEFRMASYCEILGGHLHTQSDVDVMGTMFRIAPTANKKDKWTDAMGYRSCRRFILLGYDKFGWEFSHGV